MKKMPVPGAPLRLLLATGAWGFSFPAAKAVMLAQGACVDGWPDWFQAGLILMNRMLLATVLMAGIYWRNLGEIRAREWRQGIELGLCGGLGMLLQTDAQTSIPASNSAFFTQFTCIFVPIVVAFRERTLPPRKVYVACLMVLAGCGVLSGVSWDRLGFSRGEWETIAAAALFTAQILVLERPVYRGNDMRSTATVMFLVKGLLFLPVVAAGILSGIGTGTGGRERTAAFFSVYGSNSVLWITFALTVFSTVYGYATMTRWQPEVSATRAGLIYATEPLFATLWALFLPGWFSQLAGISYPNEHLTTAFFTGAALILGANALLLRENIKEPAAPTNPAPK
jgi:drug/metabolite transporter (DMT)-like permease